jgi:hypothetical protein
MLPKESRNDDARQKKQHEDGEYQEYPNFIKKRKQVADQFQRALVLNEKKNSRKVLNLSGIFKG